MRHWSLTLLRAAKKWHCPRCHWQGGYTNPGGKCPGCNRATCQLIDI